MNVSRAYHARTVTKVALSARDMSPGSDERAGDSSDMLRSDDLMVPGLKCPVQCQWSHVRIQRVMILFQKKVL